MRGTPVYFRDFAGGLNVADPPERIAPNQSWNCWNVTATEGGSLVRRNGCPNAVALSGTNTRLVDHYMLRNTYSTYAALDGFLITEGQNIIGWLGETNPSTTDLSTALLATKSPSFAEGPDVGQGPVYMMNGAGQTPLVYNPTGGAARFVPWTASTGSVPQAAHLLYFRNRMFAAVGTGSNTVRLWWSNLAHPRAWTSTDWVDFDPNDGGPVTGIGTAGPYLLVFKKKRIYVVYDTNTGANRVLTNQVGCQSPRTIIETPIGTVFLGSDARVYITDGSSLRTISRNIEPILRDGGSELFAAPTAAGWRGDRLYLSYRPQLADTGLGVLQNSETLEWDSRTEAWWRHSVGFNRFTDRGVDESFIGTGGVSGPNSGYVRNAFTPNSNAQDGASVNFTSIWCSPWHEFGSPYVRKRLRQIQLEGWDAWDLYVSKDFVQNFVADKVGMFAAGVDQHARYEHYSLGVANAWGIELRSATGSKGEIFAYTMNVIARKD